jgi:acetylornithine/N-succinyldiaminopimelate aminotransferase
MLGTTFGGNHLACAASIAVLEVMEKDNLIKKAKENGIYLMNELSKINGIGNVRGKGLMIGFDVPEPLKELKKNLLNTWHIFTGEAKPNVIRLLPALNISKDEIDEFLKALIQEIKMLSNKQNNAVNKIAYEQTAG